MDTRIDETCLENMQALLGEQFNDTLEFCLSEFDRLANEVKETIDNDLEAATRNAHSLKSNAAQFGAMSLADVARTIEMSLVENNIAHAKTQVSVLCSEVDASKALLQRWLTSSV
ncbi:Hpt domain-containing protein [Pseudoalteromonas luteoviolacea]|uniref:Hpt domain-containing protein n=1 Tax=Pseudoalteromonas luteoviolacea TaxID=43657 RepID=UPI001B3A708C|nr:Hpt domain-containing protein [Pseudoalteromonas luteoviolacea]MBQ4877174.1 Hpt domain-containing protein [Pseudoalteromonas luteoviolacea]MBQ4906035.1 Hpt domain-containing protein [Pseudoalteromonas luteoviolacea]MCF6440822.1 Hpt domain-containing protein [Pseudoalteromonas luteoviolacea]